MKDLVDAFRDIINSGSNINKLGEILDHSEIKKISFLQIFLTIK